MHPFCSCRVQLKPTGGESELIMESWVGAQSLGGLEDWGLFWISRRDSQDTSIECPTMVVALFAQTSNSGGLHYSQLFAPFLCKWIMLHPVNIKLGHMTCFDQWNVSGRDVCRFQIKALLAFAWFHHLSFYSVTMACPRWVLLGQPGS